MNIEIGKALWNKAKTLIPGGNQLLSKRSEMFLPDQWPSYYSKAKGVEIWDLDGNKFIDMSIMSVGACTLGYADQDVNRAVKKAIDEGSMATLNCPEEVELAELLIKIHPWAESVRYSRTGGEAMAIAVRIARAFKKKDKIAFCYDDQTEILTKEGFKKFKDLKENEIVATLNPSLNRLEYHPIYKKIKQFYEGNMIHFKGQRLDLLVTPEHKVYRRFRLNNGDHFKLEEAKKALKKKTKIQMTSTCQWDGEKNDFFEILPLELDEPSRRIPYSHLHHQTKGITKFNMKSFLRFMGWYLSEGNYNEKDRGSYEVIISQSEENIKNREEIWNTIEELGFRPYNNEHHICFSSKELVQYLIQFGKSREKFIPSWIKDLSTEYLSIFADAIIKGDGSFENGEMRRFYSTSIKLINDMQEILLKLGYTTTISTYESNGFNRKNKNNELKGENTIYHLNIGHYDKVIGGNAYEEKYKGFIYCVSVENHLILVRRNGKIVWSGNSGYHGWHDWYLSSNLADNSNLDGHLLPGLDPNGVPRGLLKTALPFEYNNINKLESIVKENDIGVIVAEPIRHQEPKDDFLKKIKKIANNIGAVLIFDEITSGWRLNVGGAHLLYNVTPDIMVVGKAMSNGYPMAAIVGTKKVMDAAQTSFISSTSWTERIGPTAAIATIKKMQKENVPMHLKKIGELIIEGWKRLADRHKLLINILPPPALATFAFDYPNAQEIKTLFTQEMLKRGFIASSSVYVSFSHTEKHVSKYLDNVDDVFKFIKNAIEQNKVKTLLNGPVAHSGFQRLT